VVPQRRSARWVWPAPTNRCNRAWRTSVTITRRWSTRAFVLVDHEAVTLVRASPSGSSGVRPAPRV